MRSSDRKRARAARAAAMLAAALGTATARADMPAAGDTARSWRHLEISGARAVDRATVVRLLAPPVAADSLAARLGPVLDAYAERGFLEPRFDTAKSGGDTLRLAITEGAPARVAAVHLRGMRAFSEALVREQLGFGPGDAFRPPEVAARLDALAAEYARRGYLDAEAVLERFELSPEGVVLGIAIAEGEPTQLAEITVAGNTTSRPALVERLAGLRTRRPADWRRIREAPARLRRSGLFAQVDEPRVYRMQGAEVGVLLRVTETTRRNTAFGAVGVARDPVRDQAYVTGSIDLGMRNIFGSGRDLDVAWKRDRIVGSRLALAYRERFLFGGPADLAVRVSQSVRDSTSTWQTAELAAELPVRRNLTLTGGGTIDRSVFHVGVTGNTLRLRAHAGMRWESLGRDVDGAAFGIFEVRAETARRRNDLVAAGGEDQARVQQTIWSGRFDCGAPLARRHVLAARGEWHVLVSAEDETPVSELFEFGGARTLRGYREAQFRGEQVAYGGVEYRYGDPRAAQVYVFGDGGALRSRHAGAAREESLHAGAGVGLRARVANGAMDVSFGLGEERSFSALKVHVSFVQSF